MIDFEFRNPNYIYPPGCLKQILSHPTKNDSIELAVFQEHRYAFFYWLKWTSALESSAIPTLVTLDWHQDLCYPCDTEKEWLDKLDEKDDGEVAFFSWAKLSGNNDGHILSAAYLNKIGNIYVHCRDECFSNAWDDEKFIDKYGNTHLIKKFKTYDQLEKALYQSSETTVYFDIDLDFFTLNNPYNGKGQAFSYLSKQEIEEILSPKNRCINWIFERLAGFTIATEPRYTGGLVKSNELLELISSLYFQSDLFTKDCDWKHKSI